ncbi:MAG: RluA family pseudouridine synthase [Ilumatobacter sp.]|nr:MAG: RluA family pseudouridine synthase [Ilumatobacter sp.]
MISEAVPPALGGERLDRVVALVADISRSEAADVVAAGGVTVDGQAATSGKVRLSEGQVVEVDIALVPTVEPPAADPGVEFAVVHADADVIVVDKPAGLVVHPGAGNPTGTLANGLLARFPDLADVGDPMRPGIVHRLDAGSSGLLVVARTGVAVERLIDQFVDHTAGRRYVALVWGHPGAPHGVIDAPIGRDRRDPLKMAVVADGRDARTEYEVVERFHRPNELSLLTCALETGRTHQIRVHLTSIGHPLVGDTTYGGRRPVLGLRRPFLHAAELTFVHPTTGETLTFTSDLPTDLSDLLATLEPVAP